MPAKGKQQEQKVDISTFKQDAQLKKRADQLKPIENQLNQKWVDEKIYEIDAPQSGEQHEKYFATFPFPYMNGRLHLGHMFTFSKSEFADSVFSLYLLKISQIVS